MDRTSGKQDLAAAALLAAVSLFAWFWIRSGSSTVIAGDGITHVTMPSIYAAALLTLSALLAIHALLRLRREDVQSGRGASSEPPAASASAWRFLGTVAGLLVYAGLLNRAPLSILTMAFLFAMFWLYGHRRLLPTAIVAVIGGLAVDVIFLRFLHLPL